MKKILKKVLSYFGYKIESTKYILKPIMNNANLVKLNFDHVIAKVLLAKSDINDFNFIQIGAFDGIECDPIRKYLIKYNWKGILLEPQPEPFNKLSILYQNNANIKLIQSAISNKKKQIILYTLKGDSLPNWSKGMASFNRENIVKHSYLIPNIEKHIIPLNIESTTFENIIDTYKIKSLDLLQIDTEGFDGKIIEMFPFNLLKPEIIHFEYKHIMKHELEEVLQHLISLQYKIAIENEEDMIAVLH